MGGKVGETHPPWVKPEFYQTNKIQNNPMKKKPFLNGYDERRG